MTAPQVSLEAGSDPALIRVGGPLVTDALGAVERGFARLDPSARAVRIDLSALDALDTGGAWMIANLKARLEREGHVVEIVEARPERQDLIETVIRNMPSEEGVEHPPTGLIPWIEGIGEGLVTSGRNVLSLVSFLGLTLHRMATTLIRPRRLRLTALVAQMQEVGLNATPIIALMGVLIGVVLAFQGATQLRQFGAEVFVVDLIAISILRELGILLTAIIVAGRSGSAFTAAIGSMKVREELDAMRTLGLDPIEVLVLPRVLALLIMLPILGFIANVTGLIGGGVIAWLELGVSPGMYITRLSETDVWHLAVGMIKAPFFAVIIAVIACWQAMQVAGSAESVGQRTTASVVQAIFLVIAVDAIFSILFSEIGI